MIPVDPDECFCGAPDEGAALGLLGIMTGISENLWCAGWLTGLERILWEACQTPGRNSVTTARQSTLLRLLAEEADGWWHWPEAADKPQFIRLADWKSMQPTS
ncbi:hypothetical protein [Azospirillum sp. sgz302134]